VRVLGPQKFGLVAFAQAFTQYFVVLTEYGFNLSATRQIAIHKEDSQRVSVIFSSVIVTKALLMFVSFLLMVTIVLAVPQFRSNWPLYLASFLVVVGNVLFPVWFFQGIERMKYITGLHVSARIFVTVALFALVRQESDYVLAAGLQAGSLVLAGVLGIPVIRSLGIVHMRLPTVREILAALREGRHVFVATAAISLYTASNTFILGLIATPTVVGYFSAAEKLVKAAQQLLNPISQSVYPHISALAAQSREAALEFIRRTLRWVGAGAFLTSSALFVLAGPLVTLLLGDQYTSSVMLVRLMAFVPWVIALSNVFGIQTMLTFGLNRAFSTIIVLAGLFNVFLSVTLAYLLEARGAAISVLVTETLIALSMGLVLYSRGYNLFKFEKRTA